MKQRKRILLLSSFAVLPFTFFAFRILTTILGPKWGYFAGFGAYWVFTMLITWFMTNSRKGYFLSMLRGHGDNKKMKLLGVAPLLPVVGVFFISFLPNAVRLTVPTGVLVLAMAILNGSIEEIYWRGLYLKEFGNNIVIGLFLSTILFGAWHFSLWFAKGIEYSGGLLALVGGAYLMGLLWSYSSRKIGNIRMCIVGHVFVNVFAFTGLFVNNSF